MSVSRPFLFVSVFLLCAADFLQSGMVAFAATPIMGEIGAGPEEFSLVASIYACVAVVAIAEQQRLVERFGWRPYLACTTTVYVLGALVCASSSDVVEFGAGRIIMALGGGAFMTSARILVTMDRPGPGRFTGVRFFASGLAGGTAAAPWLASVAVINDAWPMMFYTLIGIAVAGTLAAIACVPAGRPTHEPTSNLAPARLLLLAASAFFLLYLLQRSYYDFYSDTLVLLSFSAIAAFGIYTYVRIEHAHPAPLLRVREVKSPRYLAGIALFAMSYLLLGANNYTIPNFLQRGLGYSWEVTGQLESMGLLACLVTWIVMSALIPRSPALGKYLSLGLACLWAFGWFMSRLSPEADFYSHVLPPLLFNGCFIMLGLATAAVHTFAGLTHDDRLFAHGYQIKAIVAQLAMALGTSLATLILQWRSTVQYDHIGAYVDRGARTFLAGSDAIADVYAAYGMGERAHGTAMSTVADDLARQATLVAGTEYFFAISLVAILAMVIMLARRILFRSPSASSDP
ncbi:MFS transporter [Luteibacter sp. ME-Dv--P-043b]|uniref:MFS transporter n=1 Tax=Luteibacter sp. ME-Dv--P-043b TaxID=3040291 RepID=UPI002557BDA1|nr:MFS transporter [Luteibacter sp. ME-Dv--P-043b]